MQVPDPTRCQQCGNAVAGDAPAGLCPTCLLRTAIEDGAARTLAPLLPKLHYFDDYELLEEIARGGMGVVYRARQVSLDRTVAVKMMRPGLLATETEIARFRAEARTAASLQHPNIVAIHEVGQFDGLHYFSMDFVEGPSLAALVRERPLSPAEAAHHVQILADAVQYAHSRGILHRDLKPSNVLVDPAGRPRITDFGLARPIESEAGAISTGAIVGTPAYMPPEQAAGEHHLTAASDVYSLGAIFYELLTGLPPFRGSDPAEVLRQVREAAPPAPSALNPKVDRSLEDVCLRCLEKDPARRYQTAGALSEALAAIQLGEPSHAFFQPRTGGFLRAYRLVLAALLLAALAVVALLVNRTERSPSQEPGAQAAIPARTNPPAATTQGVPMPEAQPAPPTAPKKARADKATATARQPPTAVSISPNSGAGYQQLFQFRYSDTNGAADIVVAEVRFQQDGRACVIFANPTSGRVSLQFQSDGGPGLRVAGDAGSLARIENGVCSVDLSGASLQPSGTDLIVSLPITFNASFDGPKRVTSQAWGNAAGQRVNAAPTGSWTVGPSQPPTPKP